jgi:hypothetical protein
MINVSSAMGGQFAFAAAEMTAEIKQLGPSPLRSENAGVPHAGIDPVLKAEVEATSSDGSDHTLRGPA